MRSRPAPHRLATGLAAVLLGLPLLAGCGGSSAATDKLSGTVIDPPFDVSSTPLVDTAGSPYSLTADTHKPLTMVFFGYTHCPDVCQIVMSTIASAMTRLSDSDRSRVDVVFVTTDPARDTGPVLHRWLDHFDPTFVGLTDDTKSLLEVGKSLKIAFNTANKLPGGGYDVIHSTSVEMIDSSDQVPLIWDQTTTAGEFASDIHQLLAKDAS